MSVISIVFYFVRELLFDSKKEYDFWSPQFDPRKVIFYSLMIISAIMNVFLFSRVLDLAHESVKDGEKIAALEKDLKILKSELDLNKVTIATLQGFKQTSMKP